MKSRVPLALFWIPCITAFCHPSPSYLSSLLLERFPVKLKSGSELSFPKNNFSLALLFLHVTSLSLSLSSCNCLISEKSSLFALLPDVCKDHLDGSCFPERQQELWNQTTWVRAQGGGGWPYHTLLFPGKKGSLLSWCLFQHRLPPSCRFQQLSTCGRHLIGF